MYMIIRVGSIECEIREIFRSQCARRVTLCDSLNGDVFTDAYRDQFTHFPLSKENTRLSP